MACFLVPMTTAIVTTSLRKKVPSKYHIEWLNSMLWGGVLMLAVEHISHREIVLYPPFLTSGLREVLPEMIKIGIPMTLAILGVWITMVVLSLRIFRKIDYNHT